MSISAAVAANAAARKNAAARYQRTVGAISAPVSSLEAVGVSLASMQVIPTVLLLAQGLPSSDKWKWAMYLMACMRAKDNFSELMVIQTILSLFGLIYEQVLAPLNGKSLNFKILNDEEWGKIKNWYDETITLAGVDKDKAKPLLAAIRSKNRIEYLPPLGGVIPERVACPEIWPGVYGYCGVLCFSIGKSVMEGKHKAIITSRPTSLRNKYGWDDKMTPYLGESMLPTAEINRLVPRAWQSMPVARNEIFKYLARIGTMGSSAEDEAIFTVVRLMKWANLAHIPIISSFLETHPDAWFFKELEPSLREYQIAIEQLASLCPERVGVDGRPIKDVRGIIMRDLTLMPYAKVFLSDKGDIALRKRMEELIAVAVAIQSVSDRNLIGYTAPSGFGALIDKYRVFHDSVLKKESAEEEQAKEPEEQSEE
ncbi:putative nucleocapsid protein [Bondarzewia berkeleyi negative-strand RNA virus 1]|uniref:Nucleocapsid protein n=1 Tax=Bondarzewia berkeleyi negative-strand RNA virus 1 TaxID=2768771 RepID=A0AAE7MCY5_9MONO|nr:putative nucleocapsid protein [Bondarzewia berkeleyi negative-strand RNA virus 1]QNQ73376.1 putative nucleocapsid protein [Bondarzewia berkeleyi negative-strand RNA virus 1]